MNHRKSINATFASVRVAEIPRMELSAIDVFAHEMTNAMKVLIILILLLPSSVFADGVNKKKVRKSRPKVTKPAPKLPAKAPKQPSLLESKYDLLATPTFRPTLPLFDVPVVPQAPIVETEIREYPFEKKSRKGLFILLGGAITGTAIAILLHDDKPVVVPTTTTQPVPESPAWVLLGIGLLLIARKRQIAK